jgi:DNA-binding response OmpR family regulator
MNSTVTERNKILFADKEEGIRESLKLTFAEESYSLFTASTVEEALDIVLLDQPHLIILDVSRAYFDGFRLLEEISRRGIKIKVIILSGRRPDIYTLSQAMKWGAYDYLLKPFSMFPMIEKVRNCLENDTTAANSLVHHTPVEIQLISHIELTYTDAMPLNVINADKIQKYLNEASKEISILYKKINENNVKIPYKNVEGDIEKYKAGQLAQSLTISSWIKIGLFLSFLFSLGISLGKHLH